MFIKLEVKKCSICGKKLVGRRMKYCDDCAHGQRRKQQAAWQRKYYAMHKEEMREYYRKKRKHMHNPDCYTSEERKAYNKDYYQKLKADPVRAEKRRKNNREAARRRYAKLKADPVAYQKYLARAAEHNAKYRQKIKSELNRAQSV